MVTALVCKYSFRASSPAKT